MGKLSARKKRVKQRVKIGKVAPETVAHVESLDARVEALQLLILLGLQAVTDELQQAVVELAGPRYQRKAADLPLRRWGSQLRSVYLALLLDGKSFADEQIIIALGVTLDGRKIPLGFVQAATENERVSSLPGRTSRRTCPRVSSHASVARWRRPTASRPTTGACDVGFLTASPMGRHGVTRH